MFTLTASDMAAAVTFMQAEARKTIRGKLLRPDHDQCEAVADYCYWNMTQNPRLTHLNGKAWSPNEKADYMASLMYVDKPLRKKFGSIWLMLLGSLLITLFVRWLFSRSNHG